MGTDTAALREAHWVRRAGESVTILALCDELDEARERLVDIAYAVEKQSYKSSVPDKHEAYISTTQYGFTWGPIEVQRLASFRRDKGECLVMGVYAGEGDKRKQKLEIYASPTGQSVRVWRDGKELT